MSGSDISIAAPDGGTFTGYLAPPASGKGPGVVVVQEIFGVNAVMRGITDRLAAAGYAALCPDIFWRIEPGIQITDQTEAEWQQAFGPIMANKGAAITKKFQKIACAMTIPGARTVW